MTEQNGFREYKTEDVFEIELIHGSPSDLTEVLLKLKPGEKIIRTYHPKNVNDTSRMQAFVEGLKREGIDIGKGDSQYGFRMPLPDNKTGDRELVIFRRKIKNGKIRKC